MTIITLLLGALEALREMQDEDVRQVMVLKECMEKTLKMATGDSPRWN